MKQYEGCSSCDECAACGSDHAKMIAELRERCRMFKERNEELMDRYAAALSSDGADLERMNEPPIIELDVFCLEMLHQEDTMRNRGIYSLSLRSEHGGPTFALGVSEQQFEAVRESFFRGVPLTMTLAPKGKQ